MAANQAYSFPTISELMEIEAVKIGSLIAGDPLFDVMPMADVDEAVLRWEQKDNYYGLQAGRGMDGSPTRVTKVGSNIYLVNPGVYGEFIDFDEFELTQVLREIGTIAGRRRMDGMVADAQDQLMVRETNRIRQIGWSLLTTGTFSVSAPNGAVVHTDTYTLQTLNASSWGTAATSTPLLDFRQVIPKGPAYGTDFSRGTAIMNLATFNKMMANTNAADLGGRRLGGLVPVNTRNGLNELLTGDELPNVVIYDEGYFNDSNVFTRFVPDDVVVVVGKRPGNAPLARYAKTRNANNPGIAPGGYTKVVDTTDKQVPRRIQVHKGHNGGPEFWFPGSIVLMDVS